MDPIAYEWAELTFCPKCALRSTAIGMIVGGLRPPMDMDEAIATIMLAQIERGLPIAVPTPTLIPQVPACEDCGESFEREEVA